jgi:toxin HigB-1
MIVLFRNQYLEDLQAGRKVMGKPKFSSPVIKRFRRLVETMRFMSSTQGMYELKSLHFEKLKGDLKGYYSVRINDQYRLIMSIEKNEILVEQVEEIITIEDLTNHYGD